MEEQQFTPRENMEQAPEMESSNQQQESSKSSPIGPTVGIIIIIALLVFGGLYFWGSQLEGGRNGNGDVPLILGDGSSAGGTDTSLDAMEQDLGQTSTAELEAQLNADVRAIESELQ